jgi:predicted MFS family arabinose efflux permease
VFAAVYLGFAFLSSKAGMLLLFITYGFYTAMTAGVERALITDIAPAQLRGTMLGLHSTLVGAALLPASALFGLLWTRFGPQVPFVFGASLSLLSAVLLMAFFKPGRPETKAA